LNRIAGFVLAAWALPGDPRRTYLSAVLALLTLSVLWRVFAPREWQQ
jgi:hypothetical protein